MGATASRSTPSTRAPTSSGPPTRGSAPLRDGPLRCGSVTRTGPKPRYAPSRSWRRKARTCHRSVDCSQSRTARSRPPLRPVGSRSPADRRRAATDPRSCRRAQRHRLRRRHPRRGARRTRTNCPARLRRRGHRVAGELRSVVSRSPWTSPRTERSPPSQGLLTPSRVRLSRCLRWTSPCTTARPARRTSHRHGWRPPHLTRARGAEPPTVLVVTHDLGLGGAQLYLQELLIRLRPTRSRGGGRHPP